MIKMTVWRVILNKYDDFTLHRIEIRLKINKTTKIRHWNSRYRLNTRDKVNDLLTYRD